LEDEARFQIKQQFEGSAGKKVIHTLCFMLLTAVVQDIIE